MMMVREGQQIAEPQRVLATPDAQFENAVQEKGDLTSVAALRSSGSRKVGV